MENRKRERNSVVELNRGGQTLTHFLRMLQQTLKRYVKAVIGIYIATSLLIGYWMTTPTDRYMGFKYYFAKAQVDWLGFKTSTAVLTLPNGREVVTTNQGIVSNSLMQFHGHALYNNIVMGGLISLGIACIAAIAFYRYLVKRGKNESEDEHIRGSEIKPAETLLIEAQKAVQNNGKPSRFSIEDIPLLWGQENSGMALIGAPGTGKSTMLRMMLRQLRLQNRKVVIYDISGEFVRKFYRPGIDVILNPFDRRSHSWDVWCEGKTEMDYDRLAKACIPDNHTGGDPFWVLSAQLLFSSIAQQLGERYEVPQMEHLMNIILRMPADHIANVVAGTDARNVINVEAEKLASSVRAIITAYTRNLKYFAKSNGPRFSFKKWARDDDNRSWVFITTRDDMKAALKSPLTMLIEAACSSILSIKPDQERIIGLSVDEIATLHKIPSLLDIMGTGRKFGLFPMIGYQSPFQVQELFGENGAKAFNDIIGTLAAFRINGEDGAAWAARQLGNQEIESSNENTSYGANEIRDAVSVNRMEKEKLLLLSSEIQNLPDLSCFLRLGRGLPVARINQKPDSMPDVAEGIIEAEFLTNSEFERKFETENAEDPHSVVQSIFKNARENNISDVRSWSGIKKSQENNNSEDKNNSDAKNDSHEEGISGGFDIDSYKPQAEKNGKEPELDIGL